MPGLYYVREKDLWSDVLELYSTNEFPKRLADNMKKMTERIIASKRFESCSTMLKEEMLSRAYTHVCLKLLERKFNMKHGSRVYSWASRVILNECIQAIQAEQKYRKSFQKYAETAENVEIITIHHDGVYDN